MAANLTEVARHAGVSIATASRAFGEPDRLAPATLERVRVAAAELGYAAPQAPMGTRTIAVVVPDAANPVYATLLKAIQGQAWHGRHRIVLYDADEDLRRERESIELAMKADGLVLCSPRLPEEEVLSLIGETPHVVINRLIPGASCVIMDADRGPSQAVEHLAASDTHTSPTPRPPRLLGRRPAREHRRARLRAIRHPPHPPEQSRRVDPGWASERRRGHRERGHRRDRLQRSRRARPGGRHGRARPVCPDDVSIVGIDDIDLAGAVTPNPHHRPHADRPSGAPPSTCSCSR